MNRVVLMGRLTRDPDIRYSQGDQSMAIARYTLAVDRRRSRSNQNADQQTADFISCVAFGKTAEFAEKYLHKGTKICVSGRIQTGSYTKQDGTKVYTTDVVVEEHEFAESKAAQSGSGYDSYQTSNRGGSSYGGGNSSYGNSGSSYGGSSSRGGQQASQDAIDGFMNIPDGIDEELPFT